jgi:hypothetical protein
MDVDFKGMQIRARKSAARRQAPLATEPPAPARRIIVEKYAIEFSDAK